MTQNQQVQRTLNLSSGARTRQEEIEARFWEYHAEHPEIWELFERFTFAAINRGFTHSSAKFIINLIRWESKGPDWRGENEFKIGDIYPPYYARLFMTKYPRFAPKRNADGSLEHGFFRLRKLRSAEWEPLGKPEHGPLDMLKAEQQGITTFLEEKEAS